MCNVMRSVVSVLLTAVLLAGSGCIAFGEPVKIAEGTPIRMRVTREMTSGKVKVGEAVTYEVREEVKDANGRVLIARGAKAVGQVTESKKRGILGRQGKLEFTVESVDAVDGSRVPLRATLENSGKSNRGAVIASALVLTVLAVFVSGRDITVKEGTEILAHVDVDSMVDPTKTSGLVTDSSIPATPNTKFTVLSNVPAGTKVIGELRNDGPDIACAEVIVLVRKDDKVVGGGSVSLDAISPHEKKSFSVDIHGSVEGTIAVDVNAKPVPSTTTTPLPAAPNAKFTVLSNILSGTNMIGELQNDGPDIACAEVTVLVRKDGNVVGVGSASLDTISPSEKKPFSVEIHGSADGTASIDVNAKPVPATPSASTAVENTAPAIPESETPATN